MAQVDPGDDRLERHVVFCHRYDPARREFRAVAVAAYDNARQASRRMRAESAALRARRAAGEADPREYVSSIVWEPGYARLQANARLHRRAFRRGVYPAALRALELPANVGVYTLVEPGSPRGVGSDGPSGKNPVARWWAAARARLGGRAGHAP
ncbi:MAG TPA: hypothetical protein VHV82_13185 [Sporichthyaceae bacterium]|nr:hypothetical protein [Sporichthyaceae bacterium]